MTPNTERTVKTGGDPRHFAEFSALRDEIGKLHHPARPDVDWTLVEQLCLALFRQNGVELQTTVDFTLARTHIGGLSLMAGGFAIWQSLSSDPLREALLANASPLPTPLAAKSIDELKQQTSDAELGRLAEPVRQGSGTLLEQLTQLPSLWAQMRGDGVLSQAQQLWPASQEVKRLSALWQQQQEAGAAPLVELKHYALAQERLRQLAERLNGLDEKKGRYMTVSELKTVVFAIQ